MSLRRILVPGEEIVLAIKQHKGRALWVCVLALGFAALAPMTAGVTLIFSLLFIAQLFGLERVVTNKRVLEVRTRLFGRRLQEIALRDVQAVEINRSMFRWATLRIFGSGGRKVALDFVDSPEAVKAYIDRARFDTP